MKITTVTGEIPSENSGVTLTHEHIMCLYTPFAYNLKSTEFDRERTVNLSVKYLKHMKEKYGLGTVVDATVLNLGRDMDILKEVSEKSEVYICASTGLYWNYEPMADRKSEDYLAKMFLLDCRNEKISLLKCAAEKEYSIDYSQKLLRALNKVQKETSLPMYIHTRANSCGKAMAEYASSIGVDMTSLTIGHLSDISDVSVLLDIAKLGCYIGLDRLSESSGYLKRNASYVKALTDNGYLDRILLSHDALIYSDFSAENNEYQCDDPEKSKFTVLFRKFIPELKSVGITDTQIKQILTENPRRMLESNR